MSVKAELISVAGDVVAANSDTLFKPGDVGHSLLTGLRKTAESRAEQALFPELKLPDGTLVAWDSVALRAELLVAAAGTRYSYLEGGAPFDLKKIVNPHPLLKSLMTRETIAVYHPEKQGDQVVPQIRIESPAKPESGWGQINLDQLYPEKALAVGILEEIYHQSKGIEGEAILTLVLTPHNAASSSDSLSGLPCRVTHDGRPDYGSTQSLLARASVSGGQLLRLNLSNTEIPVRLVRYRRDVSGALASLTPKDLLGDQPAIDRKTLQRLGLIQTAQRIAPQNPTNMGASTSPFEVIDAINEIAVSLPKRIASGDPLRTAQQDFKDILTRRK